MRALIFTWLPFILALQLPVHAEEVSSPPAATEEQAPPTEQKPRKKLKAHFAGSKRPPQNHPSKATAQTPPRRKSSHIRNDWAVSKTHPKSQSKKKNQSGSSQLQASASPGIFGVVPSSLPSDEIQELERKVATLEAHVDKMRSEGPEQYPHPGGDAPHGTIYFTGEWLYWMTSLGGTEFAVERASNTPGVFTKGVSKTVDFDWASGFRVGLGIHMPHDKWDIFANYTHFSPEKSASAEGSVFPLLAFQGQFPAANVHHAHAHAELSFQMLDLEIGRAFYLMKRFALRPFIGCEGAWIDQHLRVHYQGGDIASSEGYHFRNRNDFTGGGPRLGIGSRFEFGGGFGFLSSLAGTILIGHIDSEQTQIQNGIKTIQLHKDLSSVSPTIQFLLGLSWDHTFSGGKRHVGVCAGFESQYLWNQNRMGRFTDNATPIYVRLSEDLAFYGLTLMGRIDF